jgi:hypothetical protein
MKNSRSYRYFKGTLVHTFILFFASNCLTPVDINADRKGGILVVSGQISTLSDMSEVQIGMTSDAEQLPVPVTDAEVVLWDDQGRTYAYNSDAYREGVYNLDLAGVNGTSYFIEVKLFSGKVYRSAVEKLPEPSGKDFVYHDVQKEEFVDGEGTVSELNYLNIYSRSEIYPSENAMFIRWNVREDFIISPTDFPDWFKEIPPPCFVSSPVDPQRIVLYNGEETNIASVESLIARRVIDFSFKERHYFTIYQSSITRNAYEYWRKVNDVVNQVGSIFDTPPARVPGNLYNVNDTDEKVFGYFQAVNQTYSRFFLLPVDLPIVLKRYCAYEDVRPLSDYPSVCIDCLRAPNSSHKRPDWF